jgi:hypothetical protein
MLLLRHLAELALLLPRALHSPPARQSVRTRCVLLRGLFTDYQGVL